MKTVFKTLAIVALIGCTQLYAQNEIDALRYSYLIHGGTARYNAMGGAFSSLGADFSSLSTNPAGIGVYKSSELVFTPSVNYGKINSKYNDVSKEDFKYNFSFHNFGMVFSGDVSSSREQPEWKNIQFGFGVNRLQNFHGRAIMEGMNKDNTILDVYSHYAQGIHFDNLHPFDTKLAYNTFLIDTAGSTTNYVQAHYGGALQRKSITTSGGVNEMVLTLGGNFDDKLYIGGTFGFPFVRYEEISSYKEIDVEENINNFRSLTIGDELKTYGAGINFKFGMIYRITDWVRISGAFHTPTFYSLTDEYSRKMKSDLESKGIFAASSPPGRYEYNLTTPMRAIGGIAFVLAPYGSVSAEYEIIDYAGARLREENFAGTFEMQNEAITEKYTTTGNVRLGTEWVLAPFSFRAGYAMYGSPYKSNLNDASANLISGGIGIREKNYFLDFTYVQSLRKEDYYLYTPPAPSFISPVEMTFTNSQFIFTIGIKF
jgi:hypothetical protein